MISVITATYNRAHTLERLFLSLSAQSNHSFEWVVIDDGSVDDTATVIRIFAEKAAFEVKYVFQQNSGKHVAVNNGVVHAGGDLIFIVDSDDALTDHAIDSATKAFAEAAEDVVGICFRKSFFDGAVVGNDVGDTKAISMHPSVAGAYYGGDLAYIFRKASLMNNPFPVFQEENFVPELYVWNRIADQGTIVYHPCSVYLCEYLPDGYSANFQKNLRRNPKGFRIFYSDQFFREITLLGRVKCAIRVLQCLTYGVVRTLVH